MPRLRLSTSLASQQVLASLPRRSPSDEGRGNVGKPYSCNDHGRLLMAKTGEHTRTQHNRHRHGESKILSPLDTLMISDRVMLPRTVLILMIALHDVTPNLRLILCHLQDPFGRTRHNRFERLQRLRRRDRPLPHRNDLMFNLGDLLVAHATDSFSRQPAAERNARPTFSQSPFHASSVDGYR